MAVVLHKIVVAANLKRSLPRFTIQADNIIAGIEEHPAAFPAPTPDVATLKAARAALGAAILAVGTKINGVAERNTCERDLRILFKTLAAYVEARANEDWENGHVIIEASGFSIKAPSRPRKQALALKRTKLSGEILASAKAGPKNRTFYHWRYSLDGGQTFVEPDGTHKCSILLTGLPPGQEVLVQVAMTIKSVRGDWGNAVTIMVI